VQNVVQAVDINPRIPARRVHNVVRHAWTIPAIAFASATSSPRHPAGRSCRARQASGANADVGQTGPARRRHTEVSRAYRLAHLPSISGRIGVVVMALLTCTVIPVAARASADAGDVVDVSSPAPEEVWAPSSPPATATSTDGWTIAVSASNESQTPAPPLDPAEPSLDYIVGGVFSGSLHAPDPKTTAPPSGTLEVGYQVQCVDGGMMADLKPNIVTVQVVKQSFVGFTPSVVVTGFHVQPDCVGHGMIRSYAILTRLANSGASVASYYGVSVPAEE
jgi:hypothetical protein